MSDPSLEQPADPRSAGNDPASDSPASPELGSGVDSGMEPDPWDEVEEELSLNKPIQRERVHPKGEAVPEQSASHQPVSKQTVLGQIVPLEMVETAFLASTCSLLRLINAYFPLGPLLRMFFPLPIALTYLRWGSRAAWMGVLVSGLLLSVLMGPPRSIQFVMPFGLMSMQLGFMWRRGSNWFYSITLGTILGTVGFFFKVWLLSALSGDDLWLYFSTQVTQMAEWWFVKLGLLAQPSLALIQALMLGLIVVNSAVYLFVVHLVSWLLLERLGNPIPAPPRWLQVLLDYEPERDSDRTDR